MHPSPSLVFCIWPAPSKGYTATVLFNIQRDIRRRCCDHRPPIALIGHSTDSAGFSHSLAKQVMKPQQIFIEKGIHYLGLNIKEEKYMAPYFWRFPSIMYLDFEHNQRSCLRMLKYQTLDIVMYACTTPQCTISVTINHLMQLREKCVKENIQSGLTEKDLILVKFPVLGSSYTMLEVFSQPASLQPAICSL